MDGLGARSWGGPGSRWRGRVGAGREAALDLEVELAGRSERSESRADRVLRQSGVAEYAGNF